MTNLPFKKQRFIVLLLRWYMESSVGLQVLALLVFPQDFAAHSTPNKSGTKVERGE